jgi:hypothetical protein
MSRVPPLAERQRPGLSETLTGPKHPEQCQSCGGPATERWIECDPWDQPTHTLIVLCEDCEERLIEPHPRLYRELEHNAPWPGAMALCVNCRHREGITCRCPLARWNGGPGMAVTCAKPVVYHWCGRSKGGRRTGGVARSFAHPPTKCAGWAPLVEVVR